MAFALACAALVPLKERVGLASTRLTEALAIVEAVERLDLAYPKVDADAKKELKAARAELDAEKK